MTTLRQLAEAATPGPWYAHENGTIWRRPIKDLYQYGGGVAGDKSIASASKGWHDENAKGYPVEANAAYIAAANPAAILALLDTIDAQRKLLERAETVLSASYGDFYDEIFEVVVLNEITAHLEATK